MRYKAIALSAVLSIAQLQGDTLQLRDGRVYHGTYLGGDAQTVRFKTSNERTERFSIGLVRSLLFGTDDQPASKRDAYPRPRDYNDFPPDSSNASYSTGSGVRLPASALPAVPAGSRVSVRLSEPVGSEVGKTYAAVLAESIVAGGVTVAFSGAPAVVRMVKPGSLQLVQLSIDGKSYVISSTEASDSSTHAARKEAASRVVFLLSKPLALR